MISSTYLSERLKVNPDTRLGRLLLANGQTCTCGPGKQLLTPSAFVNYTSLTLVTRVKYIEMSSLQYFPVFQRIFCALKAVQQSQRARRMWKIDFWNTHSQLWRPTTTKRVKIRPFDWNQSKRNLFFYQYAKFGDNQACFEQMSAKKPKAH